MLAKAKSRTYFCAVDDKRKDISIKLTAEVTCAG